ncbi:MAG TPA: GntR family transcriptional regulator [Pusillimonas sp.]|uniref:GntR family transcriptional regulator n=1 Tax=Pusillimonas sp. TaxID=3040095 RepID=UPI002CD092CF|nr:GntR family transcriptional regulator [Pusillimonas sp.]HUH87064.1 GntR family transcriptional regulator [Pusillimonas sp.]
MPAEKKVAFRAPPSIAESIVTILRDRLAGGVYPPGSWIRESALAEEFQFSNGPIREALQTLVNDGLLVREPWKGVRVVSLDDDEIVEMFQLRLALQELAAQLAAQHATAQQIAEARTLLAEMNQVLERGDIDAQMPIGGRLSQWLCACSGNSRLEQNWSRLTYQTRMYIYASLRDAKDLRSIALYWHELVDAIERRDSAGACSAVRKLARRTLDDLNLSLGL